MSDTADNGRGQDTTSCEYAEAQESKGNSARITSNRMKCCIEGDEFSIDHQYSHNRYHEQCQ